MDELAVVCNRCGKLVFKYQIFNGVHVCRKCGSKHMAKTEFTKFGEFYCKLRNRVGFWYYEKVIAK